MAAFRLQILLDRAREAEAAAARLLGERMQQLGAQENKLGTLAGYQEEYRRRLAAAGRNGIAAWQALDWHRFLARLDEAAQVQAAEVARCQALIDAARQAWQEQRRQVLAYETLAARQQAEEAARANRREQKELDELGQRRPPAR